MQKTKTKPTKKTIKVGIQNRTLTISREDLNEEDRSLDLSFSSETPVERWFGLEILDHNPKSVRMKRLLSGAPLLLDHDRSKQIGVVETAEIAKDRKGRSVVRFGQSAIASEILQDVKDGIRQNVSVTYRIHAMELSSKKDGVETYRITDWEPLEISIVSIPADIAVGVGRGDKDNENTVTVIDNLESERTETMEGKAAEEKKAVEVTQSRNEISQADRDKAVGEAREAETARVREIAAIGQRFGREDLAREAVTSGESLHDFRARILDGFKPEELQTPDIGMSEREIKEYSFVRAIEAALNVKEKGGAHCWDNARLEKEASDEYLKRSGAKLRGQFVIPPDVLKSRFNPTGKRDLVVGTDTAGGHLVATELMGQSFIELLRNAMQISKLGATILNDLNGNVAIPRKTGGATAYWVGENTAGTESQQAFDQVALSPKTVTAFTDYSRQLLLQSSIDVDNMVKADLALTIALAIDLAGINGSGASDDPKGILNQTGIGDVAGGTNGAAPTYAHIVSIWKEVAQDNAAFGGLGWLTNAIMMAKLAQTEKFSGTGKTIVEDLPDAAGLTKILGMAAAMSNQAPSTLTKGTSNDCSAIIFGNFRDLIIGYWGGLDVLVDPYTGGTAGTVRVVVHQSCDVAVRHPESFAAMQDARDV